VCGDCYQTDEQPSTATRRTRRLPLWFDRPPGQSEHGVQLTMTLPGDHSWPSLQ